MNIALCSDKNYLKQAEVLVKSICINNRNNSLHFHIVTSSLDEKIEWEFKELVGYFGKQLTFYKVDSSNFSNLPVRTYDHISLGAYYRLQLPNIISNKIEKILYLDCDMIVEDDLTPLFDIDIRNYAVGAVFNQTGSNIQHYNRLGYDISLKYFNSGFLMINLDYWRKHDIAKLTLDFISQNPDKCKLHDQDGLNYVLRGKVLYLPMKYNVQNAFYDSDPMIERSMFDDLEDAKTNPVIIHYTGAIKPWKRGEKVLNGDRYVFYANTEPKTNNAFINPTIKEKFRKFLVSEIKPLVKKILS